MLEALGARDEDDLCAGCAEYRLTYRHYSLGDIETRSAQLLCDDVELPGVCVPSGALASADDVNDDDVLDLAFEEGDSHVCDYDDDDVVCEDDAEVVVGYAVRGDAVGGANDHFQTSTRLRLRLYGYVHASALLLGED